MGKYDFDVVSELKYATEPNAPMYRAIIRYLYEAHRKFQTTGVSLKEIYQMLRTNEVISDEYTILQVEESMKSLEKWRSVTSYQRQEKGLSLEERKKKNFIYKITTAGVEFETAIVRKDDLEESMASDMDSGRFRKLFKNLETFRDYEPFFAKEEVMTVWKNVFDTHNNLVKNAAWYLSEIQKAENSNLFNSELFLEFKNKFITYLGDYITELNKYKYKISRVITSISDEHIQKYIQKMLEFNKPFSLFNENISENRMASNFETNWSELKNWYMPNGDNASEIEKLSDKTNETITMIVSYANRLTDAVTNSQSKLDDYRSAATRFSECRTVEDAHVLFASIFGASASRSIYVKDAVSIVEDGNFTDVEEVWNSNVTPLEIPSMSRITGKRNKNQQTMLDSKAEQRRKLIEKMQLRKEEERKMAELTKDGKIILSEVGVLETFQRKVILKWLSRSSDLRKNSNKKSAPFRTETGLLYRVKKRSEEKIQVVCTDGTLTCSDIEIIFEGER